MDADEVLGVSKMPMHSFLDGSEAHELSLLPKETWYPMFREGDPSSQAKIRVKTKFYPTSFGKTALCEPNRNALTWKDKLMAFLGFSACCGSVAACCQGASPAGCLGASGGCGCAASASAVLF